MAFVPRAYDAEELGGAPGALQGAPAFAALGLDARLVAKVVGARGEESHKAFEGGGGGEGEAASAGANAGVLRGHLRDGIGLLRPTAVQRLMIPLALGRLARGGEGAPPPRSLVVKSETGSGKTLAFLLPILQGLLGEAGPAGAPAPSPAGRAVGTRALVIAPTRELCMQIYGVASRLCQPFPFVVPGLLSGGEKRKSEKARLRKGCTLLCATPGRLLDHLSNTESFVCTAGTLRWLVLDEADRLLDMGFGPVIKTIVEKVRARGGGEGGSSSSSSSGSGTATFLLSATISPGVKGLALDILGTDAFLVDASAAGLAAAAAAAAGGAPQGGAKGKGSKQSGDEGKGAAATATAAAGEDKAEAEAEAEAEEAEEAEGEANHVLNC